VAAWLTAFKVIPWGDVIAAAPTVARGAKKLWDSIRDQPAAAAAGPAPDSPEGRARALESQLAEVRKELAASTELINSLAQQNERLVEAVNILRVRTRALLAAVAIAFMLIVAIGLALSYQ
jgi:predicted  nucleic acid-binding Zn-ribbon protein